MILRLAILGIFAAQAWACSCAAFPTVKEAWRRAPLVILGTISSAEPEDTGPGDSQSIRLQVEELFKGELRSSTIDLQQGGSSCDSHFRKGQRFVFYLQGEPPDGWYIPWCTHALGPAGPGSDDLLFLRGLPRSAEGTRLSGEIAHYEWGPDDPFHRVGGVANSRVTIEEAGGFRHETVTNSAGVFEVYGLKPGTYKVQIAVPEGLTSRGGTEKLVKLEPGGSANEGFTLEPDTRVSGRVVNASGVAVKGVCLDLVPVGGDKRGDFDCSDADGRFEMQVVPAGEYWLIARLKSRAGAEETTASLHYPGVPDERSATKLMVEAGRPVEGIEFRLPQEREMRTVSGRMVFSDGEAAGDGVVRFRSEMGFAAQASVSADGSFQLAVPPGTEGRLSGQWPVEERRIGRCPQFDVGKRSQIFRLIDVESIKLAVDADVRDVTLKLPMASCR